MIRFLLFVSLFFSLSNAAITLKTVVFDNYEENASTYLVKYYPYQDFINLQLTATQVGYIMTCRNNNNPTLSCVSTAGLTTANLMRIRENSHLIDWNVYTDEFGMTLHETNFLYGLTGLLVGIGFYFGFILIFVRR